MSKTIPFFSICIPTYNHGILLQVLFQSLQKQNFNDYEVIVVNDGSTDNTREVLNKWYNSKYFNLTVIHQENKGRAAALKKAVVVASGTYTIIMDSDDYFIEDSLIKIASMLSKVFQNNCKREVAGISGLALSKKDKLLIGDKFPHDYFCSNLLAIRADYKVKGDKKEIVLTKILKDNMYDMEVGNIRVPTSYIWAKISKRFDFIFINEPFIVKEYLVSGMTKNIDKIRMKNPIASASVYYEIITADRDVYSSILFRAKAASNYFRYVFHGSKIKKVPLFSFIFIFIGLFLYLRDLLKK